MAASAYQLASARTLPARYQAALLLDFARGQDIDDAVLLRGSRLDARAILAEDTRLSPAEYLALIDRLSQALPSRETSFMLGRGLLPGHLGPLSHALLQARSLGQALDILIRHQAWLSPLLAPHRMPLGDSTALYWTDGCVNPRLRGFVVEMMMTAVADMCHWLSGVRLPWRYRFNRTRPAHIEQYEVHLGCDTRFNDYLDAMLIDTAWLDRPWPRGNETAARLALDEAERQFGAEAGRPGLLAALYDYLLERVRVPPSLERGSADFGCSPATFKRHLAQHGTHYQAELDQVRAHVSLRLMCSEGGNNERIAAYLGFHDANNFRRSFKRWTGATPSGLRAHWLLPAGAE